MVWLFFALFVLLPFADSINGFNNNGGNDAGRLSIGIAYRSVVTLCAIAMLVQFRPDIRSIAFGAVAVAGLAIPHVAAALSAPELLMVMMRWTLPVLCIEAFRAFFRHRSSGLWLPQMLLEWWSVLFPFCILVPFCFGVGFSTYAGQDAGYKGFFFAQNDVCFILIMLYAFAASNLFDKLKMQNAIRLISLLVCILLLGMKSGYILAAMLTAFFLLRSRSLVPRQKIIVLTCIMTALLALMLLFSSQIAAVIERWGYFASQRDFLGFFASGRLERIPSAMESLLASGEALPSLLFGTETGYSDAIPRYSFIEMDFVDLFFQFGAIGLVVVGGYYLWNVSRDWNVPSNRQFVNPASVVMFLMAFFAGHVLWSALSGMVVAVVLACGIANRCSYRLEGGDDAD